MQRRHPLPVRLPRLWLMTDERQGETLWAALGRLPRGGGIVFRHYRTPIAARRALYEQVRAVARRRRLVLVLAGHPREAIAWRADGAHSRSPQRRSARPLLRTVPAHDAREIAAGRHADLLFVSPAFATRSHPGALALGPLRFAALAGLAGPRVIALGGMDERRMRRVRAYGWAAIDAWGETHRRRSAPIRT